MNSPKRHGVFGRSDKETVLEGKSVTIPHNNLMVIVSSFLVTGLASSLKNPALFSLQNFSSDQTSEVKVVIAFYYV